MSRASEIGEWRKKATAYRAMAGTAASPSNRRMLIALADEADCVADDIEDKERFIANPMAEIAPPSRRQHSHQDQD